MALVKCPECSREISSSALTCPHCGFQLNPTFATEFTKALAAQTVAAPAKPRHISTGMGLLLIIVGSALAIGLLVYFGELASRPQRATVSDAAIETLAVMLQGKSAQDAYHMGMRDGNGDSLKAAQEFGSRADWDVKKLQIEDMKRAFFDSAAASGRISPDVVAAYRRGWQDVFGSLHRTR
jgi:hypothetical protein